MYLSTEVANHEFQFFCLETNSIEEITKDLREVYKAIVKETDNVPNLFDIRLYSSNLINYVFFERIALGKESALDYYTDGEGIIEHIQDIMKSYSKEEFHHGIERCIQEFPTLESTEDIIELFMVDALYIFNLNQWRYHDIEWYPAYNMLLLSDKLGDILNSQGKVEFDVNNPMIEVW